MKKIIILLAFISILIIPSFVFASDFGSKNLQTAVGSQYGGKEDLGSSVGNVVGAVLALAGTIFLALTVYGGITWMIAMGNSEKVEKAKNILTAAVIGGAITVGAYAITFFVFERLSQQNIGAGGDGEGGFHTCCSNVRSGDITGCLSDITESVCRGMSGSYSETQCPSDCPVL